ncbi:MAG TPA: glycosyltransferase [Phycisphaerales bacterium]|nr:glycosyltransferase [Phycisphaerales bacterium]
MKILLVSPYYPPQNAVASRRVHAFACAWAQAGHSVTVLTTAKRADQLGFDVPSPGVEVIEIPFAIPLVLERLRRVHKSSTPISSSTLGEVIHDSQSFVRRSSNPIIRALRRFREYTGAYCSVRAPDLTDFWVEPAVQWAAAHGPWDAVVSSSGPYTAHLVALALKTRRLAQFWVQDFRDLWTRNHLHHGLFPFTLREHLLELRVLQNADLITTVSQPLADHLSSRTEATVEIIYNGFDPDTFTSLPADPFLPREGRINLVYAGTYYPSGHAPLPVLEALAFIARERTDLRDRFRLHLAGQSVERLLAPAHALNISDLVINHGLLSRTEALRLVRDANILLFLDWHNPSAGVLTGKIFEYLAASAPILAVGPRSASPVGELLARTKRGLHLGMNSHAIAEVLLKIAQHDSHSFLPVADFALVNSFTRSIQARRLINLITELTPAQT